MTSTSTVRGGTGGSLYIGIAQGNILGTTYVAKFGRNPDIDAGTEDIWSQGATWVAPTAARIHSIVGGAADVNTSGTGAWTVSVQGLNGSYVETTETVAMAGAAGVDTLNSYLIIYRMIVLTAGTGGTNSADITAVAASDSTVTCAIVALRGQSQMCIYQVPAGYTAYMHQFGGSFNGAPNANVILNLFSKPLGGVWNLKGSLSISAAGSSAAFRVYTVPTTFAEKTLIKLTGTSDSAGSDVMGEFDIILVAN